VGDGGYIYFASDPTAEVSVQSAGDATVQDLHAISAYDELNLLVGGDSNAILVTSNGGQAWSAVTGPSGQAAVDVTAVYMISTNEWLVAYADGKLYYTIDRGLNWRQKALPGSITAVDG